jgi:hypothetical protein
VQTTTVLRVRATDEGETVIKFRSKTMLALGAGLGYLAGSPKGREQTQKWLEQLKRLRNDPATRRNVDEAVKTVKEQTTKLADKVQGASSAGHSDPIADDAPVSASDTGAGI